MNVKEMTWVELQKLSPSRGGGFYHGQFSYPAAAQGGGMVAAAAPANGMLPMYPLFHWHPHQSQGMALPTSHFFPSSTPAAIPTVISTKPTAIHTPAAGTCIAKPHLCSILSFLWILF